MERREGKCPAWNLQIGHCVRFADTFHHLIDAHRAPDRSLIPPKFAVQPWKPAAMPGDPLTFDQATSDLDVPRDTQGADHLGVLGKLSPRESSPAPGVGGISSTRDMAPSGAPNQS